MFVGVCRLVLLASHCHSLKEKRNVIRRVKDRTRARFDVAMAEVGGQDTWQRIVLGFAIVASERKWLETTMGKVTGFIDSLGVAEIEHEEHEILHYGDEQLGIPDSDASWVPAEWRADADGDAPDGQAEDGDREEGRGE